MLMTIGIETLGLVLGEKELQECGVTIASDLIKIGITTIFAEAAGLAAAGTTVVGGFAAGPIIVAIVVGVMLTFALEYFDTQYNITNRVAATMERIGEKILKEMRNEYNQALENVYQGIRHWIYYDSGGFDIQNPIP